VFLRNYIPQRTFLILGGIFGFIFIFVTPPFQVPDEWHHFLHAYNFSEGRLRAKMIDGQGGDFLPASLSLFSSTVNRSLETHPENKQDLKNLWVQFRKPLNPEQRKFLTFPHTARYCPITYLPQAIGIILGRWWHSPPVIIFYLGRLTNLICWCLMIAYAIKLIPVFKWVTVFLALTPMSLFQSASLSADSFSNGIAFLTIALFLHLAIGPVDRFAGRHLMVLLGLVFLLAMAKQIYVLLFGLYFLIPAVKFQGWKAKAVYGMILVAFGVAVILFWACFYSELYPAGRTPWRADGPVTFSPKEQLFFIIGHPLSYLKILAATFKNGLISWMAMFVGILGWIDTPLPNIIYYSYFPALAAVIHWDKNPSIPLSLSFRFGVMAVFIALLLGILTALYLTWNLLQAPIVEGFQGRYLVPISLLAVLPFYWSKFTKASPVFLGRGVLLYLVPVLLTTVWTLVARYYIG
jgi:uncharacterized membrane protein